MSNIFTGKKVAKNAGWIIAGKVYHLLLSFFIGLLTARYLGPDNYGLVNYAALYTSFFTSLCTLGINSIIVKNFVDHPDEEGEALGTALLLRAVSSTLSAVMIIAFVGIIDSGEPLTITVVALCSLSLLFQIFDTINYWFQSRLNSKYSAIATAISYTVVSIYKILLLVFNRNVKWFAVATSIDYAVSAVTLLIIYKKSGGAPFSFSIKKSKELLSKSKSFIISGLMVSIYNCTDRFMLKHMLSSSAVGYYSVASSVCNMWVFLLSAIIDSFNPTIMQAHKIDRELYHRTNKKLYAIVFYISIVVSAGITVGAKIIVGLLYGKAYLPAAEPLRIITWYTAFSYLGVARNAWMVCENKQKYLSPIYICAALMNIVLNWLLIPYWGASGAAAASLMTQISTVFFFPFFIKDLRANEIMMLEAVCFRGFCQKGKNTMRGSKK